MNQQLARLTVELGRAALTAATATSLKVCARPVPTLEAMACGCPVLASTAPAVRETCGDAARYFDPSQPAELAVRLQQLFASPAQQAQMRAAGIARANQFSWRQSAVLNLAALAEEGALGR